MTARLGVGRQGFDQKFAQTRAVTRADFEARRGEANEPRRRLAAAGDDDLFSRFGLRDELGEAGLGLADLYDEHHRLLTLDGAAASWRQARISSRVSGRIGP
jgi:hypothetical protein